MLEASSEDAIKADALNYVNPLPGTTGYGTVLRSIRTPFLERWNANREEAVQERSRLSSQMRAAREAGRRHEFLATAGQSAGAIRDVLPVAEIIRRLVRSAEAVLAQGAQRSADHGPRAVAG